MNVSTEEMVLPKTTAIISFAEPKGLLRQFALRARVITYKNNRNQKMLSLTSNIIIAKPLNFLIDHSKFKKMESKLTQLLDAYETGKLSRKSFIATLGALFLTPAMGFSSQGFSAKSLNHVTLAVTDIERSKKFYEDILGASVVSTQKNGVNLGLGDSFLGLYNIDSPPRIHHFCVGLDKFNVDESADKLRSLGLDPYVRKDKPEVYFTDPDGITVQLENKSYRG